MRNADEMILIMDENEIIIEVSPFCVWYSSGISRTMSFLASMSPSDTTNPVLPRVSDTLQYRIPSSWRVPRNSSFSEGLRISESTVIRIL